MTFHPSSRAGRGSMVIDLLVVALLTCLPLWLLLSR